MVGRDRRHCREFGRPIGFRLAPSSERDSVGAAAPYFYEGQRGRYAARIEALALAARKQKRGLWKACPRTRYDPYSGIETRR